MSIYKGNEKVLNNVTSVNEEKVKEIAREEVENSRAFFTSREVVTLPFTAPKSGLLIVLVNPPSPENSTFLVSCGNNLFCNSSNAGQQYSITVPMLKNDAASIHMQANANVSNCVFYS